MMKKVKDCLPLFAQCLALLVLFTLLAASAVGQCSSPIFPAGRNVDAGTRPVDIAAGDFNGDGIGDFVVANANSTFLSLILGSATGALTVKKIEVGGGQSQVAAGHFNNDGKLDLAILHGNSVAVRLGNGIGGFGSAYNVALGGGSFYALLVADFNGDSKLDVFIGDGSYGSAHLLLGNGSGGLSAPSQLINIPSTLAATAGDFNNDDKVDLAVVNGSEPVYVSLGDGTGHFGDAKPWPVSDARDIESADFNNDGKLDFVTISGSSIFVRLGNGAGGFGAAKAFNAGFGAVAVAVGDINGDGKPDLVPAGDHSVGVLPGLGTGSFGPAAVYKVNKDPLAVALGDVNGDGKLDVGTPDHSGMPPLGAPRPGIASVLLNAGAGKLSQPSVVNSGASPFGVAAGDLNGDGKTDLAVTNVAENKVAVLRGNGAGGFGAPTFYAVDEQPSSVAIADLNNDGRLDLVTTNYAGGTISILLNTGTGFSPRKDLDAVWSGPAHTGIGDFNNDGKPDLVIAYQGNDSVWVMLGDGAGGFSRGTPYTIPYGGYNVAIHDFNRDGKADLVAGYQGGVAVLLGDGRGGFGTALTFNTNTVVISVAVGDFNGDGKADIAGVSSEDAVSIFLGNGLGGFTRLASLKANLGLSSVTAADFDGDGKLDLATAHTEGTVSLFVGKGTGAFAAPLSFITGGALPRTLVTADFNADGRPDIAVANQNDTFNFPPPVPAGTSVLINTCSAPPAAVPSLSVSDVEVTEGDGATTNATFTVNLSSASTRTVTVSFYPAGQEAASGADFKAVTGRLTFAPGETSKTIVIPIIGDALDEPDESFNLFLVHPLNAQLGRARARAKILDNDLPPAISVNNVSQAEGNSGASDAVFTVTLSKPSGKTVTVKYATANGTTNPAAAGTDYTAVALKTLTFLPGEVTKTVTVQVRGDLVKELNETFFVNLSAPANATIADAQGLGTILNDD